MRNWKFYIKQIYYNRNYPIYKLFFFTIIFGISLFMSLSLILNENAFGDLGPPIIVINEKAVDISEIKVTPKHLPNCGCIHLHPETGNSITTRDGTVIADPAQTMCGFGCVESFPVKGFIADLPMSIDTDRDGVSNTDETKMGTDPTKASSDGKILDFLSDTDGDNLTYEQELAAGYNITLKDSNGNNIEDGIEVALTSVGKDWYKIPILIDILKDSTTDPARMEELVEDMNFVLMQNDAKIMFHLVEVIKHTDNDGDPNGNGIPETTEEEEAIRDSGKSEIATRIHQNLNLPGKGLKMTYVKTIPDAGGLANPGNPVTLLDPVMKVERAFPAHVIAALHEFMHVLGLFAETGHTQDTPETDDNGPENPLSTHQHGYEFYMSQEEGKGLEGVKITSTQIQRMQDAAKQFGIPGTGGSPYFMKQWQSGSVNDPRGDQAGVNPSYLDITDVNMESEVGDDLISIVVNLGGLFPSSGPIDATYSLSFDTDDNQFTGSSVGTFDGIEKEVVIRVTGDASVEPLLATAIVFDNVAFLNTVLIPNPEILEISTQQTGLIVVPNPVGIPSHHQIHFDVSKSQLNLSANDVPVGIMTRDQPDIFTLFNEIDVATLDLDLDAYASFPTLTLFAENAKEGDFVNYDILGLTPNTNFDLKLDNIIVDSGTTDNLGDFSSNFTFPQTNWGFHFLTVVDEAGLFTFNGINGGPLLGDFKCYNSTGTSPMETVTLKDQFFTMDYQVRETLGVCANILKQPGPNFTSSVPAIIPDQHFRVYNITEGTPIGAVVRLSDQFGLTQHTVGQAIELWVPSNKTHVGFFDKFTDIHYKCYELDPINPPLPTPLNVNTIDQFGNWTNEVLKANKLCNPVTKIIGEESFGDYKLPDHLKCYTINPDPGFSPIPSILFGDQFVSEQNNLIEEREICLVTQKEIIDLPDQDEDDVSDFIDNCPSIANPHQRDLDDDSIGDVCDSTNIITSSREITSNHMVIGDVMVQNNALLTIPDTFSLNIPSGSKIIVKSGSGVLIKSGGTLQVDS